MRLLHVHKRQLEEFFDVIPPYAILSHTWSEEEVTFSDVSSGQAKTRKGYAKVENTCLQAARRDLDYCWIDTCCIDKNSSNELSEAINSMFKWYASSQICFAFLEDVSASSHQEDLPDARWFKRGWTLQELLAPTRVVFFDKNWEFLGDSLVLHESTDEKALSFMKSISLITGIHLETLRTPMSFTHKSIARRMSWAWNRKTTRVEDIAYCLLGIFQVNMPLLYGEGERAFVRLQEEIIKNSTDHSIFVWGTGEESYRVSCLAPSPKEFKDSGMVVPFGKNHSTLPYAMTNKGLQIQLPVMMPVALLDCHLEDDFSHCFAIELDGDSKTSIHTVTSEPFRIRYENTSSAKSRTLYLPIPNQYRPRTQFGDCGFIVWACFYPKRPCDYVLEDIMCEKVKILSLNRYTKTAHLTWNSFNQQQYAEIISVLFSHVKGGGRFVVLIECNVFTKTFFEPQGIFEVKGLDLLQYTSQRPLKEWYEEHIIKSNHKCTNRFEDRNEPRSWDSLDKRRMHRRTLKTTLKIESRGLEKEVETPLVVVEVSRQLRFGHQLCVLSISFDYFAISGNEPSIADNNDKDNNEYDKAKDDDKYSEEDEDNEYDEDEEDGSE